MYVEKIPNRNSTPTILVRESKRDGNKIIKTTIANITGFPKPVIEGLRILFRGGTAVQSIEDAFDVKSNKPHGHVAAVLGVMKQLGMAELIAPNNSRFRRLVLGMIAARVLAPASKLTTSAMLDALLVKVEARLDRIVQSVHGKPRRLKDKGKIGVRVGKVFQKYKMRKFFTWEIEEGHFSYTRNAEAIQRAERLDGVYAIRSSLKREAEELVTDYKRLSSVEWAFRTMKSMSLQVRLIHHRKQERVVAHIFLCMLAYYVEYHLRQKLAPMLFSEEDPEGKKAERKSIVEPAKPSAKTTKKARTKRTADGGKAMSYQAVMEELSGGNGRVVRAVPPDGGSKNKNRQDPQDHPDGRTLLYTKAGIQAFRNPTFFVYQFGELTETPLNLPPLVAVFFTK